MPESARARSHLDKHRTLGYAGLVKRKARSMVGFVIGLGLAGLLTGCTEEPEPSFLPERRRQPNAEVAEPPARREAPPQARREAPPAPLARPGDLPPPPDVAAPPADAVRTPSGLATKVLERGTGTTRPGSTDGVTVHYSGWRAEDGIMFDSSHRRGEPITFAVNGVIRGWTEALQLMVVGEKRRLWIPGNLAYDGQRGPQGMLVFDVELLGIHPAPPTPPSVSAPPANARRSESGLAWIVLRPGEGTRRPGPTDTVEAHYAGWRAEDGELFDSSLTRNEPLRLPVGRVIPGWQEGLQLMVEGEKRRFWIPANLAYEGREGPQGMLVFDVELLRIL